MARVKVTAGLFAYNHARYVGEAVRSALAQTYPMQLIVVDDGSTDGTADVIKAVLAEHRDHHHEIVVLDRASNVGFTRSINEVMSIATGELVVEFAGDDVALPNRVERLVAEFQACAGRCHALGSGYRLIDEEGRPIRDVTTWAGTEWRTTDMVDGERNCVLGASMAWRREVFDVFGPLPAENRLEDVAICFRAGILGTIRFIPEVLLCYREHGASGSREMWPVRKIDSFEDFRQAKRREATELAFIISHHDGVARQAREKRLTDGAEAAQIGRVIARFGSRYRYLIAISYGQRLAVFAGAVRALATRGLRYEASRAMLLALTWQRYQQAIGILRAARQGAGRLLAWRPWRSR